MYLKELRMQTFFHFIFHFIFHFGGNEIQSQVGTALSLKCRDVG